MESSRCAGREKSLCGNGLLDGSIPPAPARSAASVAQQNAADNLWDEKTQRQAKSISNLFVKFVVQDQRMLRQEHVGRSVDFLRFEIYKHYGKSVRDEGLTIEQLREKGSSVEKSKRGISGETLNGISRSLARHSTTAARADRKAWKRSISRSCAQRAAARRSVLATSDPNCRWRVPRRSSAPRPSMAYQNARLINKPMAHWLNANVSAKDVTDQIMDE
jgi:hypothetical protein